jgi:transposase
MIHIGVDMHKNFSNFAVLYDGKDSIIEQRLDNHEEMIRSFLDQLPGDKHVAVEANRNWYWFVDLLEQVGVPVELSNPFQTKAIAWARVKTDTVDARMLAYLLKAQLLPTCWIPDRHHRNLREFVRFRTKLVRLRTQVKNHLRALLSKHNLHPPLINIWGPQGRQYLERLSLGYPQDQILSQCLEIIDLLNHQIHTWNETIRQQIKDTTELKLLCSAPGIGPILAITILLETGPITRFPSAKKYAGYAGLVPKVHASAGKTHYGGHLSRQANLTLRWAFVEAATDTTKGDSQWSRFYHRMATRKGKSIAKVALARKMSKMVYHMLKRNIDYHTYLSGGHLGR